MDPTWPPGPPRRPWVALWLGGLVVVCLGTIGMAKGLTIIAIAVQALFLLFLVRHLSFALSAARTAGEDTSRDPVDPTFTPDVSVVVALKNEISVIAHLLEALDGLEYPSEHLQIILVDDASQDGTGEYLDSHITGAMRVLHRRAGAGGGKSGALNAAIEHMTGEIVIVFDADHRPANDIIRRHVRHYMDPTVAAVQGRCRIGNPDEGAIAGAISLEYEAGYLVNEYGRQAIFGLPAYGGANCSVRATSLIRHGGWNPTSHTEDTDLTMRLVLAGEHIRYDVSAVDVEEAVTTFANYWRQRYRWARGHQKVLRDYWRIAARTPHLTRLQRIETLAFLGIYHTPVVAFGATVLGLAAIFGVVAPESIPGGYIFWPLLFLGPLAELGAAMLLAGVNRRRALGLLWFVPLYALSMLIATKAWIDGIFGRRYTWVKTARTGTAVIGS